VRETAASFSFLVMLSIVKRPQRRKRAGILAAGVTALEAAGLWLRTQKVGGNMIVRCRQGHLFTTLWIPGASVKSLRLGWWRFQHCPVGGHWSLVTPVNESALTEDERRLAREHRDIRVP
jgi:hypothetical protein